MKKIISIISIMCVALSVFAETAEVSDYELSAYANSADADSLSFADETHAAVYGRLCEELPRLPEMVSRAELNPYTFIWISLREIQCADSAVYEARLRKLYSIWIRGQRN